MPFLRRASLALLLFFLACGGGLLVIEETVEQPTLDAGCVTDAGGKAIAVPCDVDGGE